VSGSHPLLTTHRRLGPGAVRRQGSLAPYRSLQYGPGEPHLVRDELGAAGREPGGGRPAARARPLLSLVHITDLQLADVQSPARFEFLNRYYTDPRYAELVPVQRPQEGLTAHAIEATLATVNAARGPATGMAARLAVTTGDAIDNTQWNELQNFLALFDGGPVRPGSGGPGYAGVQSPDWPDDIFWTPDGDGAGGPDIFAAAFGFPRHPGLLDRAMREFTATGLVMPWLSCFGNHEALIQGVGVPTPALAAALTGGSKPTGLAENFDHDRALELFTHHPEAYFAAPLRAVTPDPARRTITRQEFVAAHFRPGAQPAGHGFTERNRLDGTAFYVHDTPAVRFIALDTNCLSGGADGGLDHDQARWLEERLAEVHSAYRAPDGSTVRPGQDDRLVVLFSHHGTDTLISSAASHAGPGGEPALGGGELTALLHRFPNVVLWLNGHTHLNAVRARPAPGPDGGGFWEVTTCAVIDWPCQTRLVELIDSGDDLAVVCTMLDHDTPAVVTATQTSAEIASLHRELAANVPFGGADSGRAGAAADRNVDLRIRAPFPLSRLPGA
jgi:metallophosphoesterase (TIGR03767 family)